MDRRYEGKTCPRSISAIILDGLCGEVVEDIVVEAEELLEGEWSGYVMADVLTVVLDVTGENEGGHGTSRTRWKGLNNLDST